MRWIFFMHFEIRPKHDGHYNIIKLYKAYDHFLAVFLVALQCIPYGT